MTIAPTSSLPVLDAAATEAALPFARLIPALRELFIAGCEVPQRHSHTLHYGDGPALTSLLMPAWQPGGYYAVKIVNIAPGNAARGLPGLHASLLLHDASTGVPLLLMDGDQVTARRTAAASALAASYLARPDAGHLLVLGAGRVAALLPEAYSQVRRINRVTVWARKLKAAQALADKLYQQGFNALAVEELGPAVAAADIISCATLSNTPLVQGRWLQPGSHLDLIGGFTPGMREADDNCFVDASLFVDTEEALAKSGDLLTPMHRGLFTVADVRAQLHELCKGTHPGRVREGERTVFKSVGTALEDLAAAMLAMLSVK
jgi:ornithine cyclodeaminase/alanine dehydrogenase-like protein (mu-crystallin family)